MTSISVSGVFEEAIDRVLDPRLVPIVVALFTVQLATAVGQQSQLAVQRDELIAESPFVTEELLPETLPLALDIPVGVAMILWVLAVVSTVTVTMVAFRALVVEPTSSPPSDADATTASDGTDDGDRADDGDDGRASDGTGGATEWGGDGRRDSDEPHDAGTSSNPSDERAVSIHADDDSSIDTTDLGSATVHGLLAGFVLGIAFVVGLAALILPGLVVATLFAFTFPAIAAERLSFVAAIRRSFVLTTGNRIRVFGIVLLAVVSYLSITFFGAGFSVLLEPISPLGDLLDVAVGTLAWLLVVAILACGYDRLTIVRAEREAKWEGIDDELLP